MTGALSPTHWLILLVVVLLVFGAKRLPDAARGVGRSLRIFKAETAALSAETTDDGDDPTTGSAATGSVTATTSAPAPAPVTAPARGTDSAA